VSEHLIRCFIAVNLPAELNDGISEYLRQLARTSKAVKWVRAAGVHLTLKFLGEIEAKKVEEVQELLPAVSGVVRPFQLTVHGAGCFPNKKKPRVFWLGFKEAGIDQLSIIYHWLEDNLERYGFSKETRKFSPHLTLGRVKSDTDFTSLFAFIEDNPFPDITLSVEDISLIRSQLLPAGAQYTELGRFPLSMSGKSGIGN
jgi:2'-5' RNA ligase